MLRTIRILLFMLPTLFVYAQDVSYYRIVADTAQQPITKLNALDSILSLTRNKDFDTFISTSFTYIELAKEIDSIELAAKKTINVSYPLANVKNEPRKVITLIDGILARKYLINSTRLLGNLHLKRGRANFRIDLHEAVLDYENAINSYSERDSLFTADTYLFSGQAYSNLGEFVPAGESYQKAYDYFEALKDYEYMIYAQQGITTMFSMNGFYEKALEERTKNIAKVKELGLDYHLISEYYNQAIDYKKQGDTKMEIAYLLKAEKAINDNKKNYPNPTNGIFVYAKLIEYYSDKGILEKAEGYFDAIEAYNIRGTADRLTKSQYDGAFAHYYLAREEYNKALEFAERKLENSQILKYEDDIIDSHFLLSKIYQAKSDYKKGLYHNNQYAALKDSVYNSNTANSLAYYQTLYEIEKKEKELVAQNSDIQLLEKDNSYFRKLLTFILIAFLLITGLAWLFRKQQNLKNKKQLQERFSQELLVSQEEERKRIAKDLHDGLGQKLLLIKNKTFNTDGDDIKKLVDDTIEEVRGISRDLHPFQLQEMGITKAIMNTLQQIDENTTLFISSEIDNIDNIFTPEQEVNIYRIIQESLSNILKHAKAEAGKVMVKRNENGVLISIKDNGTGFSFPEKFRNTRSLGLKTLMERTKFLNGQMKIHSKKNNGTLVEFKFPML